MKKTPLILLSGDGPLVAPIHDLLDPHTRIDAVIPIDGVALSKDIPAARVRDGIRLSAPDEIIKTLSDYPEREILVVGSLQEASIYVDRHPTQEAMVSKLGRYHVLNQAIASAGRAPSQLGALLPRQHTIDAGRFRGREPDCKEKAEAAFHRERGNVLTKDWTLIAFRLEDRRRRRNADGPLEQALKEPHVQQLLDGGYIYARGSPVADGLAGCPLVTEAFLGDAKRLGVRGVFIETALMPVAIDCARGGEELLNGHALAGEDLDADCFVYAL